jgi:hypothetical protein
MPEPLQFTGPDTRPHPRSDGTPVRYRCVSCEWRGKGSIARAEHWKATGHVVVYADDPRFVYATFAFDQPDFKGGTFPLYNIHGGRHDRSTVSAETLATLGIEVRK